MVNIVTHQSTGFGKLPVYGCDVAQCSDGQACIESILQVDDADVAALNGNAGDADQGGDLNREYATKIVTLVVEHLAITL